MASNPRLGRIWRGQRARVEFAGKKSTASIRDGVGPTPHVDNEASIPQCDASLTNGLFVIIEVASYVLNTVVDGLRRVVAKLIEKFENPLHHLGQPGSVFSHDGESFRREFMPVDNDSNPFSTYLIRALKLELTGDEKPLHYSGVIGFTSNQRRVSMGRSTKMEDDPLAGVVRGCAQRMNQNHNRNRTLERKANKLITEYPVPNDAPEVEFFQDDFNQPPEAVFAEVDRMSDRWIKTEPAYVVDLEWWR